MLVTAVIPVHNHRRWVWQAVESVTTQDHRPLRVVVVDDGSTDGSTDEVLAHLANVRRVGDGPRVALGQSPEGVDVMVQSFAQARGPSFARNWGMNCAWDGDAFAFLDSDDYYHPGKISRSVQALVDGDGLVGAVYSDYETLRPDGLRVRQYKPSYSRELLLRECVVNCDSVVLRSALERSGLFDESLRVVEDLDLWLRLSEEHMIVHLPEALVTVRTGQHSSTDTVGAERWRECYARVMQKVKERRSA